MPINYVEAKGRDGVTEYRINSNALADGDNVRGDDAVKNRYIIQQTLDDARANAKKGGQVRVVLPEGHFELDFKKGTKQYDRSVDSTLMIGSFVELVGVNPAQGILRDASGKTIRDDKGRPQLTKHNQNTVLAYVGDKDIAAIIRTPTISSKGHAKYRNVDGREIKVLTHDDDKGGQISTDSARIANLSVVGNKHTRAGFQFGIGPQAYKQYDKSDLNPLIIEKIMQEAPYDANITVKNVEGKWAYYTIVNSHELNKKATISQVYAHDAVERPEDKGKGDGMIFDGTWGFLVEDSIVTGNANNGVNVVTGSKDGVIKDVLSHDNNKVDFVVQQGGDFRFASDNIALLRPKGDTFKFRNLRRGIFMDPKASDGESLPGEIKSYDSEIRYNEDIPASAIDIRPESVKERWAPFIERAKQKDDPDYELLRKRIPENDVKPFTKMQRTQYIAQNPQYFGDNMPTPGIPNIPQSVIKRATGRD